MLLELPLFPWQPGYRRREDRPERGPAQVLDACPEIERRGLPAWFTDFILPNPNGRN